MKSGFRRRRVPGAVGSRLEYDDETVTVVGNPRRSFGYLYVGAWFKADLPIDEPPPS